jgi:hypothetical protein
MMIQSKCLPIRFKKGKKTAALIKCRFSGLNAAFGVGSNCKGTGTLLHKQGCNLRQRGGMEWRPLHSGVIEASGTC